MQLLRRSPPIWPQTRNGFYVDTDEKPAYLLSTKVRQEGAEDWIYVYVLKDGQIMGNFSGVMEENNK